jgi:2-oxo-4-hydroxy-4-carboxy-5-ureidoimidazoline decarboxylase
MLTIGEVNALGQEEFVATFGAVFEHSPWVAGKAWESRPFQDRSHLHSAMVDCVHDAGAQAELALIQAHPDLVGRAAREGRLGAASTAEQASAALDQLSEEQILWFERYNRAYRDKFGFPFIICVRANRQEAILNGFRERLLNSVSQERAAALEEISKIAAFRLADLVEG